MYAVEQSKCRRLRVMSIFTPCFVGRESPEIVPNSQAFGPKADDLIIARDFTSRLGSC